MQSSSVAAPFLRSTSIRLPCLAPVQQQALCEIPQSSGFFRNDVRKLFGEK